MIITTACEGFQAQSLNEVTQLLSPHFFSTGLPYSSDGKESAYNAQDLGSVPRSGKSPGEGNGNPLQYSCLDIPWTEEPGGLVHGVVKSWT